MYILVGLSSSRGGDGGEVLATTSPSSSFNLILAPQLHCHPNPTGLAASGLAAATAAFAASRARRRVTVETVAEGNSQARDGSNCVSTIASGSKCQRTAESEANSNNDYDDDEEE